MGDYTGFRGKIILKEDTPKNILYAIDGMLNDKIDEKILSESIIFAMPRFSYMFRSGCSVMDNEFPPGSSRDGLILNLSFNIKNYSQEIEFFLDWLCPYIEKIENGRYRFEYGNTTIVEKTKDEIRYMELKND